MMTVRKSEDRGHQNYGWLDTRHTFSFGDYHDPNHMGFRALRVINDDRVTPGAGFPSHPHRDMEILTYVLEGALEHRDSMGNGSTIRPGEIQRMSAGTGIVHSEFNHSKTEPLHLLQIWIIPERRGGSPSYEQKHFSADGRRNTLRLLASRDGSDGSVAVQQDVRLYGALLSRGEQLSYELAPNRYAWIHVARGSVHVNDIALSEGDGLAIEESTSLTLDASHDAELLVFDLS